MALTIDKKYAELVSAGFNKSKIISKDPLKINFRCVVCNDSQKNKHKARGYLIQGDTNMRYFCHNCGHSEGLKFFLKNHYPEMYQQYLFDTLAVNQFDALPEDKADPFDPSIDKWAKRRIDKFDPFKPLQTISAIRCENKHHPAGRYIEDRKIPFDKHYKIYWTDTFYAWINSIIPNKFESNALNHDCGRILFPLIDIDGYVVGVQGGALPDAIDKGAIKYITIMFNPNSPKVYGIEDVDFTKKLYIVEGPIDSMFIDNSLAMVGSDFDTGLIKDRSKAVIIFDNQPRNQEVVNKYDKYLAGGFPLFIPPEYVQEEDINDMIKAGRSKTDIKKLIDENTFTGLTARAQFTKWKKI